MNHRWKLLGAAVVALAFVVTTTGLAPASAAGDSFAFSAYVGGTKASALGLTVTSDLTAESSIKGVGPDQDQNKVAGVKVARLLRVGAVNTDTAAQRAGKGFRLTGHARTADVNLLNGLIRATAVETTSTATDDGNSRPSASSSTELLGLTIAGKKYPAKLPANTSITVPGLASITVNYTQTAVKDDSVVTVGAGLVVTLLKQRNGVAAGAEIMLNPSILTIVPMTRVDGGSALSGAGYGAYIFAHVGDRVEAKTGYLGAKPMPMIGTGGAPESNSTASIRVPGVLQANAVNSTVTGISIPAVSDSDVASQLTDLKLFPGLFGLGGLIQAKAIRSTAHTRLEGNKVVNEGSFTFLNLRIAGKKIPVDVPPNTSIHVAHLGTVTINEQKSVSTPGVVRGFQVTGLHVVLDTARAGLPVGAEIQVGVARSMVWG